MRGTTIRLCMILLALGAASGCGSSEGGSDGGTDGPHDAGCPEVPALADGERPDPSDVTCPAEGTPAPEEQMGSCCWRHSNADQLDAPEMRLTYLRIVAPVGSTLTSGVISSVLNKAMQEETFNWLYRVEGADGDGPVTITTGFGRRQDDGTYAFSSGAEEGDPDAWCPVTIDGSLAGDTITSDPIEGSITVPIFDEAGENVQIELTLRQLAVAESTWGEDRSCVGWKVNRPYTYEPAGVLTAFIEVEAAKRGMITIPPTETTVCTALAAKNIGDAAYCDRVPQADWDTPPDSLCDASGCRQNSPCMSDVCDPATTCNAWALVAHFAAAGVDITNSACGG